MSKCWSDNDFDFCFVQSDGSFAGLCLVWNSAIVVQHSVLKGSRWIAVSFDWYNVNMRLILIYASNDAGERLGLWEELAHVIDFDGPVLLIGDFNEIVCPEERKNCNVFSLSM